MRDTDKYQKETVSYLERLLKQKGYEPNVKPRWRAFAGHGRSIYSPVLDIAVGPFAIHDIRCEEKYDEMVNTLGHLIDSWATIFKENWQRYYVVNTNYWRVPPSLPSGYKDFIGYGANRNARCFIAIEIENETTRKHLMGSIVNAGALGRVGILIAWKDEVLRAAIRMREYFDFLQQAKKRTFNMSSVIVLSKDQFIDCLEEYLKR